MSDSNEDKTIAFGDSVPRAPQGGGKGATVEVPRARLVCLDAAQIEGPLPNDGVVALVQGTEQVIGRDAACSYPVPSRKLSRKHARLFAGVGVWGIEDLNSTNGVLVNRQRVKTAWLKHGDEVRFGPIPFRFELERPEAASEQTVAVPSLPAADDGDGERTMMVGSLGASKAVLDAVRKPEAPAPVPMPPPHRQAAGKPAKKKGLDRKLVLYVVAGLLLVGLVTGGVLYYPTYKKKQEIAAVVEEGNRVARTIIIRSRDLLGTPPTDIRYEEDVQALKPALDKTWYALAEFSDQVPLAGTYARLRFLSFERTFAALFSRDQFQQADQLAADAKARLIDVARALPPETPAGERADLTASMELLDFARLLVEFRKFARQYPQVSKQAEHRPTMAMLADLDRRKDAFIRYRRTYNKVLSVDYMLFNGIVQDVESRDLTLINHWKEFLNTTGAQ